MDCLKQYPELKSTTWNHLIVAGTQALLLFQQAAKQFAVVSRYWRRLLTVYTGAGIVGGSDPDREWQS